MTDRYGSDIIEVLGFLIGCKVSSLVHDYLRAVRPSSIRFARYNGVVADDAKPWRVTIYLDHDNRIACIEQEVEVGLTCGARNGHELMLRLKEEAGI